MQKILNYIIKYSIYGLVVLMPLFFLPWTGEMFEFNKQYLLLILVSILLIAWLIKIVVIQKKFLFKRTPLDLWIALFAIIMIFSASFSIDKISSWIGFYNRFTGSIIILLVCLILYFILINNIVCHSERSEESRGSSDRVGTIRGSSLTTILNLLLASSFIAVITGYFSLFNIWSKIPGLPEIMRLQTFNTVSSSFQGLSIFLVAIVCLIVGMLLTTVGTGPCACPNSRDGQPRGVVPTERIHAAGIWILLVLILFLIIIIDFTPAWIALGLTMLILLGIALYTRLFKNRVNILLVPIILLIIAITGFFLNIKVNIANIIFLQDTAVSEKLLSMPQELILDYNSAQEVVLKSIKEYPAFGSGPGTFLADFAKFKPVEFNQTRFWNVRFDKAPSHIMEMLATAGIVGIISYLLFIIIFLLLFIIIFFRKKNLKNLKEPILIFPFILGWLALLIGQFVYMQNIVLIFCFWLFTALVIIALQRIQNKEFKQIDFSFEKLPEVGLIANVILMLLAFGLISVFYLGGKFYWADIKFNQAVTTGEELIQNSEKAVIFNKYRSEYRRGLSQLYLQSAWIEARKSDKEIDLQLLEEFARGSLDQADAAVKLSPNNVSAQENMGAIYRDAKGLIGGTLPLAIDSYIKALELEPNNPFFHRELCRLNLISEDSDLDKALEYCKKAVELKPTYLDAHVQLALVYEQKGDLEKAVEKLQSALDQIKGVSFNKDSEIAGVVSEIYFQLGRVYFNLNDIDQAIAMFEQAIVVMSNHANARYSLALAYQAVGRAQEALEQLQIVNQLVPGNENVLSLIGQLEEE